MDFDKYIKSGEPDKQNKAYAWRTAIGLQKVDGLKTSEYLRKTAERHINGDIDIDRAQSLIKSYYKSKKLRTRSEYAVAEADTVSSHIAKILNEPSFSFSFLGLTSIHRRLFEGVFDFAGQVRDYDITKEEWVLNGDTVLYVNALDLQQSIEYDIEQEKSFSYKGLPIDKVVEHLAKFISNLWQIHPFGEGNTRTTAVFLIKYLRSIGFKADNDLFAENSWYFRNALVRANYRNVSKCIEPEPVYLIRFLRNLLMNEHNQLMNRYLIVNYQSNSYVVKDVVKRNTDVVKEISPSEKKILSLISKDSSATSSSLAKKMKLSSRQVQRIIAGLKVKGKLVRIGGRKSGHWKV